MQRQDPSKRAQIRMMLGSRLAVNARSADRAFARNVTIDTAYFQFSYLFVKRMIRASDVASLPNAETRNCQLAKYVSEHK